MEAVKVKRDELIEILETNLKKHMTEYEEAYKEFRTAGVKVLADRLKEFQDDETDSLAISPHPPISHEEEYEDVIALMKVSCDDVIELNDFEAKQYILNKWNWSSELVHSKMMYARTMNG